MLKEVKNWKKKQREISDRNERERKKLQKECER